MPKKGTKQKNDPYLDPGGKGAKAFLDTFTSF